MNQLSKARLSRSEKRKIANSASRGEMKARRTTRQAMCRRYPLGRRGASRSSPTRYLPGVTFPAGHKEKGRVQMNRLGKLMTTMHPEKTRMVAGEEALPGRSERAYEVPATHDVLGTPLEPPFPEGI